MTADDKSVTDLALVYAPLGFLLEARELIPKMAERGRGQVALARLAGTVAAQQGRAAVKHPRAERNPATPSDDDEAADPNPVDQAIAEYDTLKAANVVKLLDDLDDAQLEVVLEHERAHRARATIINRIVALQR